MDFGALLSDPSPWQRGGLMVVAALAAVVFVDRLLLVALRALARRTRTTLDDIALEAAHAPLVVSVLLVAVWAVIEPMAGDATLHWALRGVLGSVAVLAWAGAARRVGFASIEHLLRAGDGQSVVQPRSVPLFEIVVKTVVFGGGVYFLLLAWEINVTAWLASAGVIGIAVGFAAKDTVANLFAGLFILADSPYKLGDYVQLDRGVRGEVTQIGLRSTRIVTRDHIEVVVPNSVMAAGVIVNESGGPGEHERIRVAVRLPYDADLRACQVVLMEAFADVPELVTDRPDLAPRVRYRAFEDSGIKVELLGWVRSPHLRGSGVHHLVLAIHERLRAADVEIPLPQRVLHWAPTEHAGDALAATEPAAPTGVVPLLASPVARARPPREDA